MLASKRALRAELMGRLGSLSTSLIAAESRRMVQHVVGSPLYAAAGSVALFLSMGAEVQTGALVTAALEAGKAVFVPRVTGRRAGDMHMLLVAGAADIASFVPNGWGIPEPSDAAPVGAASPNNTGATAAPVARIGWRGAPPIGYAAAAAAAVPPLAVVFVPGVAFDAAGARLGHGKGYYDVFIQRVRSEHARRGLPGPLIVGLCLEEQLLEPGVIPMGLHDQHMDVVCTPAGMLACQRSEPQGMAVG